MNIGIEFLNSSLKHLQYYKDLGNRSFNQLKDADFHFKPEKLSNSIATIICHMSGNMISRWTDFLTTDGEKEWRNRDTEFETNNLTTVQLLELWEKGWSCCLNSIKNLSEEDLLKTIHIRKEPLIVIDAINRQLSHLPYHVGQIVYIAKVITANKWNYLSIPPGKSQQFNKKMQNK